MLQCVGSRRVETRMRIYVYQPTPPDTSACRNSHYSCTTTAVISVNLPRLARVCAANRVLVARARLECRPILMLHAVRGRGNFLRDWHKQSSTQARPRRKGEQLFLVCIATTLSFVRRYRPLNRNDAARPTGPEVADDARRRAKRTTTSSRASTSKQHA